MYRLLGLTCATAASKNHKHSVNNPYSQFRDGWSVEQVLAAPKITKQLTKFMCSPTSVSQSFAVPGSPSQRLLYRMVVLAASWRPRVSCVGMAWKTKP